MTKIPFLFFFIQSFLFPPSSFPPFLLSCLLSSFPVYLLSCFPPPPPSFIFSFLLIFFKISFIQSQSVMSNLACQIFSLLFFLSLHPSLFFNSSSFFLSHSHSILSIQPHPALESSSLATSSRTQEETTPINRATDLPQINPEIPRANMETDILLLQINRETTRAKAVEDFCPGRQVKQSKAKQISFCLRFSFGGSLQSLFFQETITSHEAQATITTSPGSHIRIRMQSLRKKQRICT